MKTDRPIYVYDRDGNRMRCLIASIAAGRATWRRLRANNPNRDCICERQPGRSSCPITTRRRLFEAFASRGDGEGGGMTTDD